MAREPLTRRSGLGILADEKTHLSGTGMVRDELE